MRVNVYAEEMTDRIEIIHKTIDGQDFTGLRFYLELPATGSDGTQHRGPFLHRPGDDDSGAVTFWGKTDLRVALRLALAALDAHYEDRSVTGFAVCGLTSAGSWSQADVRSPICSLTGKVHTCVRRSGRSHGPDHTCSCGMTWSTGVPS